MKQKAMKQEAMKHVTGQLHARLGGELDAAAARDVEAHLSACATCREEAERLQSTWDALAIAAVPAAATRADLWTGVRERTLGRGATGWFFGRGAMTRLSLALATLALGVLVGRWTGTLGGKAAADDDSDLAGVWLEDSTWHDQATGGLADSWLAMADGTDRRQGTTGTGGTK